MSTFGPTPLTPAQLRDHLARVEAALAELRAVAETPAVEHPDHGWWLVDTAAIHILETAQALARAVADHGRLAKAPACFVEVHHKD